MRLTDALARVFDSSMTPRRSNRVGPRTDEQIRANRADMELLRQIAAGGVVNSPEQGMDLRRLARDDLILVGFAKGSVPTLLPRATALLEP